MDAETILTVENISKQYRLGQVGTGTISHDLNRWWSKIRGKEDPYLRIGDTNDRSTKGESDYVWALRDINFEVKRGEVIGIIGKNGAGKSTLLKILSKVTSPTTGTIRSKGRIASLLEVGTGFHPELTGRENIYLNGAILGMTKKEISSKINDIVEFSGCERYIDTPTKRYSSGMTVRLAFAVAAFLEPEILIIDEVLAVGDAEFQKKALGKMQDISSGEGRTVLFVSHNMAAVKSLCNSVIVIHQGEIKAITGVSEGIETYLALNTNKVNYGPKQVKNVILKDFRIEVNSKKVFVVDVFAPFDIVMEFEYVDALPVQTHLEIFVKDHFGVVQTTLSTWLNSRSYVSTKGVNSVKCNLINGMSLVTGTYYIDLRIADNIPQVFENVAELELQNSPYTGYTRRPQKEIFGGVYTPNRWEFPNSLNDE